MSDDIVDQWYPAWRFHPTLPAKIVQTAAEDAALESGWVHTPAELLATSHTNAPEREPEPKSEPVSDVEPEVEPEHKSPRPRRK